MIYWVKCPFSQFRSNLDYYRTLLPCAYWKINQIVLTLIFKASALWAHAFYKSKCPSVCPSVCVSVCSLLRYRLNVFLPPNSQSPQRYGILWEKLWKEVVSYLKTFTNKGCKIAEQKELVLANSGLINHQSLGQFCKVETCFVSRMWDFLFSTRNFQFVTKKIIIVCQNPLLYQPRSISKYQKVGSLLGKWLDPVSFKT